MIRGMEEDKSMFESWLCHSSSVTVVESSVYAVPRLSYHDDHDDDVRSLS